MNHPLMKCGHVAMALDSNNKPVCPMCIDIVDGADEVDENQPDLTGRQAMCECGCIVQSSYKLPFFFHKPESEYDEYYCRCMGWD